MVREARNHRSSRRTRMHSNRLAFSLYLILPVPTCLPAWLLTDLEWRIVYVGSAASSAYDQELEDALVGPVPAGRNRFAMVASAPDLAKIPADDRLGMAALLVLCSYKGLEFVRVGYLVNNMLTPAAEAEGITDAAALEPRHLQRTILADHPRVTTVEIDWLGDGSLETRLAADAAEEAQHYTDQFFGNEDGVDDDDDDEEDDEDDEDDDMEDDDEDDSMEG